jgi:LytR cell envelope-related transcriptional attenuator
MGSIPFAFSVHHFISSVGADAGFAAIIGLAILVLLYFAQARETSSLRDQAAEAGQRVQQLEAQVSRLGRPQPSNVVRPPAAAAPVGSGVARPAALGASVPTASPAPVRRPQSPAPAPVPALVGAPAGVGAPALSAATRLIPSSAPGAATASAPASTVAPSTEAPGVTPAAEPPPAGPGSGAEGPAPAPAGPPPATAAGGAANGANRNRAVPAPVPAAGQAPPRVQFRPPAAGVSAPAPAAGRRPPDGRGRSAGGRALLLALGVIGVAVVVALLLILTSPGSNSTSSSTGAARASNAPRTHTSAGGRRAQPAIAPASVTVAVLNGTSTSNLAHRVALKLAASGYKQATIATAPDQTHTATVVAYLPGERRQALAVANSLKLGSASVQPVDQSNQAVACPPGVTCAANVVVIVGSDLAATA